MPKHSKDRAYQAYRLLQIAFIVAPILVGLDKFFNFMVFWPAYLAPFAFNLLGGYHQQFMMAVGVVEIIAGLGVIFKPRIFSYIVALWLLCIILNLLLTGQYFDIALRDVGLLLGALALGRLSGNYK